MSALFSNLALEVGLLRKDRLMLLASSILADAGALSEPYLLGKLKAAEADAERRLRVFFGPVTVFPRTPTDEEVDGLNGGRWAEEAPYDYEPGLWSSEDWGYLVLRQKPVVAIEEVKLAYPAPTTGFFTVPLDWLRVDKRVGHVRFVPTGSALSAGPLSAFLLSAMGGGRTIPQMIQIRYKAGLQNVAQDYPDLLDLVRKMAVVRVVQDAFLPQSGSISADGLSQSVSVDMDKYSAAVESGLDTLRESIHGVRMMVL